MLRFLYFVYCCLWFCTGMFLVVPLVAVASLFGRWRGGNIIYILCRAWAHMWYFLIGIRHRNIFESPCDAKRPCIFVMNHISYLDIPACLKAIRHRPFRVLGKAEMAKIPVFGFIYSRGAVLVDRSSASGRARSVRQMKRLLHRGISVAIFPEGTFNETHRPLKNFYDGAFRIALETGTPIRPVLFLDNYRRMGYESIFSLNPGRSRAVFLDEISPAGYAPGEVKPLKELVYRTMETKLQDYKADWIRDVR